MTPRDAAHAVRARLASQIADDRATLNRLAGDVRLLLAPSHDQRAEWMRGLALAFEIERYYTAAEAVLVRVLRAVDGDVPAGPGCHQEILRAACVPVARVRPAIVSKEVTDDLGELLKFRHLARHGYEAEPQLQRLVAHAERLERVHPVFIAGLEAFERWLASES